MNTGLCGVAIPVALLVLVMLCYVYLLFLLHLHVTPCLSNLSCTILAAGGTLGSIEFVLDQMRHRMSNVEQELGADDATGAMQSTLGQTVRWIL